LLAFKAAQLLLQQIGTELGLRKDVHDKMTVVLYRIDACQRYMHLADGSLYVVLQGQAYPQEPIMRAMRNTDREALLRRLALAPPGDLPAGCGQVAIAEEDAAGVALTSSHCTV